MAIYSIYKLTNTINGKAYIGFTSKDPERRWQTHLEKAQSKVNRYLYDAINKYGWENFTKEVLYCSHDGEHTLKEMEPHFIREYNTFFMNECGYNMTLGGDGVLGHKASAASRKKRSERSKGAGNPFYGKHRTAEANLKTSAAVKKTRHLRVGELAPNFGKTHTEAIRKQIGDTQGGSWLITFPDGHKETIHNLRAFCRDHMLTTPLMMAVVVGKQHHHKGFKCEKAPGYVGGPTKWQITDPAGNEIIVENLRKWCRENEFSFDNLWRVSQGKIPHTYGYKCKKLNLSDKSLDK